MFGFFSKFFDSDSNIDSTKSLPHESMTDNSLTSSPLLYNENFPYSISGCSLARYSADFYQTGKIKTNRLIIVGGRHKQRSFFDIIHDNISENIFFKSFKNDYKFINANLKHMGLTSAVRTHTFITSDNNYLIVIYDSVGHNIYDLINDKWLFIVTNKTLQYECPSYYRGCTLINDQILIVHKDSQIDFYQFANNFRKLIFVKSFQLKQDYTSYGMSTVDFSYKWEKLNNRDKNHNTSQNYTNLNNCGSLNKKNIQIMVTDEKENIEENMENINANNKRHSQLHPIGHGKKRHKRKEFQMNIEKIKPITTLAPKTKFRNDKRKLEINFQIILFGGNNMCLIESINKINVSLYLSDKICQILKFEEQSIPMIIESLRMSLSPSLSPSQSLSKTESFYAISPRSGVDFTTVAEDCVRSGNTNANPNMNTNVNECKTCSEDDGLVDRDINSNDTTNLDLTAHDRGFNKYGFECIINKDKEAIIMLIGGYRNGYQASIVTCLF